jgi:single-strand DNA-binding protein
MALYENKVTLKGYIGKNTESFVTKQQKIFVVFSLATKSGYKDKQTEQWVNHTEWHHIVAFGTSAERARHLLKGDYVEIEGELRSSQREIEAIKDKKKTKIKVTDWEVRASKVTKLEKSESSRGENLDAEPVTEDDAA